MTSLLQHHGGRSRDGRKVELLFQLVKPSKNPVLADSATCGDTAETFLGTDGKARPVLHRAYRRPAGMWGCWVVFRYCGEEHVPDLSVPISVFRLPRDAVRLTDAEAEAYWRGGYALKSRWL